MIFFERLDTQSDSSSEDQVQQLNGYFVILYHDGDAGRLESAWLARGNIATGRRPKPQHVEV